MQLLLGPTMQEACTSKEGIGPRVAAMINSSQATRARNAKGLEPKGRYFDLLDGQGCLHVSPEHHSSFLLAYAQDSDSGQAYYFSEVLCPDKALAKSPDTALTNMWFELDFEEDPEVDGWWAKAHASGQVMRMFAQAISEVVLGCYPDCELIQQNPLAIIVLESRQEQPHPAFVCKKPGFVGYHVMVPAVRCTVTQLVTMHALVASRCRDHTFMSHPRPHNPWDKVSCYPSPPPQVLARCSPSLLVILLGA